MAGARLLRLTWLCVIFSEILKMGAPVRTQPNLTRDQLPVKEFSPESCPPLTGQDNPAAHCSMYPGRVYLDLTCCLPHEYSDERGGSCARPPQDARGGGGGGGGARKIAARAGPFSPGHNSHPPFFLVNFFLFFPLFSFLPPSLSPSLPFLSLSPPFSHTRVLPRSENFEFEVVVLP